MTDFPAQADVLFVGAGHNALVAAAYLLDAGRSVCLLDRMPQPGGWVQTAELGAPGFLHDRWSALHPAFVGGPVWAELGPELRRHGLQYLTAPLATGASLPDGRTAIVPTDPQAFGAGRGGGALRGRRPPGADADGTDGRRPGHPAGAGGAGRAAPGQPPEPGAVRCAALRQRDRPGQRPFSGGGHRTLLPGAWLIGAATWPGPSVSGASGRAVARALIGG